MTSVTSDVSPTEVLFPAGTLAASARVQLIECDDDGRVLLVADRTPFHPLDHTWPDQPADRGTISFGGESHAVVDAVTGAVGPGTDGLLIGKDIPVRRGEPGWVFVAVHILDSVGVALPSVGQEIEFIVDGGYRDSLSAGHSACHLVSLALNKHLAPLWAKTPRLDCLGNPDFDQSAITESRITQYASVDRYRLGKSLRKSGFGAAALADQLETIQKAVNEQVAAWIEAGSPAHLDCDAPDLSAHRWWNCELPDGTARIPCGGTHVASAAALRAVEATLDLAPTKLTIRTRVHAAP